MARVKQTGITCRDGDQAKFSETLNRQPPRGEMPVWHRPLAPQVPTHTLTVHPANGKKLHTSTYKLL